jgi:calcineurin-like phosphoesterase family protein
MNETIINNWNKVVTNDDIVIHVGDFKFKIHNNDEDIMSILNGHKVLVTGNHDRGSASFFKRLGFNEVYRKENLYIGNFIFSHKPVKQTSLLLDKINIHGHVHNTKWFRYDLFHFNVSCEVINYTPISFDVIKKISKTNNLIETYINEEIDAS